jgi:phosphoribosylpyrophosphate synthetase
MAYENLMVFTGTANPMLAHQVVKRLNIPIGHAAVGKFSDGEISVEILENVRGKDCFVLQSTCMPTNDNLMEVLIMVDALRRASAGRITAAIPYFGYARQDRRPRSARVAISAKVVANMLVAVGVNRVLTMDLHADQIQGFSMCRWTLSTPRRCCSGMSGSTTTRTRWWSRRMWAAWCVPGRSPSAWSRTWPSSTSAGRGPMWPRWPTSSAM